MKKTEFITFRTDLKTKETLEQYATEKKWTISFLVEEIVRQWIEEREKENTPGD